MGLKFLIKQICIILCVYYNMMVGVVCIML